MGIEVENYDNFNFDGLPPVNLKIEFVGDKQPDDWLQNALKFRRPSQASIASLPQLKSSPFPEIKQLKEEILVDRPKTLYNLKFEYEKGRALESELDAVVDWDNVPEVNYDSSNQGIKSLTIERWVLNLTSELDSYQLHLFFLVYRFLLPPQTLLSLLISRYDYALKHQHSVVHIRTFVCLRYWLTTYYDYDFLHEVGLRRKLSKFSSKLEAFEDLISIKLVKLIESRFNKGFKKLKPRLSLDNIKFKVNGDEDDGMEPTSFTAAASIHTFDSKTSTSTASSTVYNSNSTHQLDINSNIKSLDGEVYTVVKFKSLLKTLDLVKLSTQLKFKKSKSFLTYNRFGYPTNKVSSQQHQQRSHILQIVPNLALPDLTCSYQNYLDRNSLQFLFDYELEVVAHQFILIESRYLKVVSWDQYVNWPKFNSKKNLSRFKNLKEFIDRFNLTCQFVTSAIVSIKELEFRTKLMERFILLAELFFQLGNFNTLLQILLGLNSGYVLRLNKTWSKLSPTLKAKFDYLNRLANPLKNWKVLRECVESRIVLSLNKNYNSTTDAEMNQIIEGSTQFSLPFLGLYLSDLSFNYELDTYLKNEPLPNSNCNGNDIVSNDLEFNNTKKNYQGDAKFINYSKFNRVNQLYLKFQLFQKITNNCNYKPNPYIFTKCFFLPYLSSNQFEKFSSQCEP